MLLPLIADCWRYVRRCRVYLHTCACGNCWVVIAYPSRWREREV